MGKYEFVSGFDLTEIAQTENVRYIFCFKSLKKHAEIIDCSPFQQ